MDRSFNQMWINWWKKFIQNEHWKLVKWHAKNVLIFANPAVADRKPAPKAD